MLRGIDISNWQRGFDVTKTRPGFCIVKATEGTSFIDPTCDGFVRQCEAAGIPWGFYHFARTNEPTSEARFFSDNTKGYSRGGIPVLDFEVDALTNDWLDTFMLTYHELTGVFPWLYTSASYINDRGIGTDYVKANCGLWLAGYPKRSTAYPADATCPYRRVGWRLAAWQFTDRLSMGGMSVDGDFFYGDAAAWNAYANPANVTEQPSLPALDYEVARMVIEGDFGDGDERRDSLGERYDAVQRCVNRLLEWDDRSLAQDVIDGQMGSGEKRKWILGKRYAAVQRYVNMLLGA